jgi:hypothetical protein
VASGGGGGGGGNTSGSVGAGLNSAGNADMPGSGGFFGGVGPSYGNSFAGTPWGAGSPSSGFFGNFSDNFGAATPVGNADTPSVGGAVTGGSPALGSSAPSVGLADFRGLYGPRSDIGFARSALGMMNSMAPDAGLTAAMNAMGPQGLINTLAREGATEGQKGMAAVMASMVNRAIAQQYGASNNLGNPTNIGSQYSAVTDQNNAVTAPFGTALANQAAQAAVQGIQPATGLPTPVQNATNYFAFDQVTPAWAQDAPFRFGAHSFGNTAPSPSASRMAALRAQAFGDLLAQTQSASQSTATPLSSSSSVSISPAGFTTSPQSSTSPQSTADRIRAEMGLPPATSKSTTQAPSSGVSFGNVGSMLGIPSSVTDAVTSPSVSAQAANLASQAKTGLSMLGNFASGAGSRQGFQTGREGAGMGNGQMTAERLAMLLNERGK